VWNKLLVLEGGQNQQDRNKSTANSKTRISSINQRRDVIGHTVIAGSATTTFCEILMAR
jgi:hypothetical protein